MAAAALALTAIFHPGAFHLTRTTLTARTIRGEAEVRGEGEDRRVGQGGRGDLVEDPVKAAME